MDKFLKFKLQSSFPAFLCKANSELVLDKMS